MKFVKSIKIVLSIGLLSISMLTNAQNTEVNVSGLRSTKGQIVLSVYNDAKSYTDNQPQKQFKFDKKNFKNGNASLKISLQPGTYGIILLDDENSNNKTDNNFLGIPKEGFGFSNYFLDKLKRPLFNEFKTEIKTGVNKVVIKVKYM